MRLGLKVKFWRTSPAPYFYIAFRAVAKWNARMRKIRYGQKNFAYAGIQVGNPFIGSFYLVGNQFHFRDQSIGGLFVLLQPRNFIAGPVPLCFALFVGGNQLAPFFVEPQKSFDIEL